MLKLSVIIPVYNVEKFLPRCLDSMLRQGLEPSEWEVICVNDGSPDNCATILAEYQQKHPEFFKVITQENLGLDKTRNAGLAKAQGEWIGFVDSDDYVIDNAYKYLLEHFCDEGVDVIHFCSHHIYTNGVSLYDPDAKPNGKIMFDGNGAIAYNQQKLSCVWSKFYRRSFLEAHHIRFEVPYIEDELFNFEVFLHYPHLRVVTSSVYRYEQGNSNSLQTTVNKEKIKKQLRCLLNVIDKMNNYIQSSEEPVLKPAAVRNLDVFSVHYYNKMLKAQFTWSEWRQCALPIKLKCVHELDVSKESSFFGRTIALLKNGSGSFYVVYFFTAFLLNTVFRKWIRPRIINTIS